MRRFSAGGDVARRQNFIDASDRFVPKSISTCAPNFVADRGAGRCVLGRRKTLPENLGRAPTPAAPKL
jgi:hypothetical protein